MHRTTTLAIAALAVCLVAGCDHKKPAPNAAASTPTHTPTYPTLPDQPVAAPDPNRPPTDDEMLAALLGFWRERGGGPAFAASTSSFGLATPIGAKQADDAVTTNVMGLRYRRGTVTYTFRANADASYDCGGSMGIVLFMNPIPSPPQDTYHHGVSAGGTFSCSMMVQSDKVEEGWNIRPVDGDPLTVLFKR